MFTKEELLRISRSSEEDFLWARKNRILPTPRRMGKSGVTRTDPLYPEYAVSDLHQVSFLRSLGFKPGEIRRLIFGEDAEVLFEEEMEKEAGGPLAVPVRGSTSEGVARLTKMAEEVFAGRRIIQQAFREEKRGASPVLILSRVVLGSREETRVLLEVNDDLEDLERVILPEEGAVILPLIKGWLFPHLVIQKHIAKRKKDGRCISVR